MIKNKVLVNKDEHKGCQHSTAKNTNRILRLTGRNTTPVILGENDFQWLQHIVTSTTNDRVLNLIKWLKPFEDLNWDPESEDTIYGPDLMYQDQEGLLHPVEAVRLLPAYIKDTRPTIMFSPIYRNTPVGLHVNIRIRGKDKNTFKDSFYLGYFGNKISTKAVFKKFGYVHEPEFEYMVFKDSTSKKMELVPFSRVIRLLNQQMDSLKEHFKSSYHSSSSITFHSKSYVIELTILLPSATVDPDKNLTEKQEERLYEQRNKQSKLVDYISDAYSFIEEKEDA